jgi:hypothetical protein
VACRQRGRVDTERSTDPNDWFMWVLVLPACSGRPTCQMGWPYHLHPLPHPILQALSLCPRYCVRALIRPLYRRPLRPAHIHSACCFALLLVTRPATVSLAPKRRPKPVLCWLPLARPERSHSMHVPMRVQPPFVEEKNLVHPECKPECL